VRAVLYEAAGEEATMDLVNRMMGAFEEVKDALPKPVVSGFRRIGQDEKMERLHSVPILEDCTSRQLREVARITDVVEHPAETVLTRTGDPGEEFFLIVDGTVRVDVPGGQPVMLGPGQFFGEMSLLDGGPRSATVIAETAIRVLVIRRRHFSTLLREAPGLMLKILATLARRVRDLERARSNRTAQH
jgi:CRP-like cAMP-binding protein